MNYRELLEKYMDHVLKCEGVSFLLHDYGNFTAEELAELYRIENALCEKGDCHG